MMAEVEANRANREHGEHFYVVMQEMYGKGPDDNKYESPNNRLIQLKNSTTTHKTKIKGGMQREDYSLVYCSSPGKSYVMEPVGGELNYKMAEKNPLKFYD